MREGGEEEILSASTTNSKWAARKQKGHMISLHHFVNGPVEVNGITGKTDLPPYRIFFACFVHYSRIW